LPEFIQSGKRRLYLSLYLQIVLTLVTQFSAIQGHGWDSFYERTIDTKLRLGKVLHGNQNRNIHDVTNRVTGSNNLQETIDILREENANLKKIYAEQLGKYAELQRNRPELVSADPRIREMQTRNDSFVQQIQSKNVQISNLSAQVNNMRSQINRLANERNGNSISGQTVNQTLVMELLDQNESYKTLIASKDAEILNLLAQVNALRVRNSRLGSSSGNNGQSTAGETNLGCFDSKSCCIIM